MLEKAAPTLDLGTSTRDEEMEPLEKLSTCDDLTVDQMVRPGVRDFIGQLDRSFRVAARRVMEKNAGLYRRLS